jgi:hypothetical protein
MERLTQEKLNYIEEEFFKDGVNTRLGFEKMLKMYDVTGRDEIVENISMRILTESNTGKAVYSDTYEKNHAYGNDYATAERAHQERNLTWYHFDDDDITKKLPGVESDFVDVI